MSYMEFHETNPRKINPDGVYRYLAAAGHPIQEHTIDNVAKAFGLGTGTLRRFIAQHGLEARLEEETAMAKIDMTRVRELYDQGLNDRLIATAVGCSRDNITKWRDRNELPAHRFNASLEIVSKTTVDAAPVAPEELVEIKTDTLLPDLTEQPEAVTEPGTALDEPPLLADPFAVIDIGQPTEFAADVEMLEDQLASLENETAYLRGMLDGMRDVLDYIFGGD